MIPRCFGGGRTKTLSNWHGMTRHDYREAARERVGDFTKWIGVSDKPNKTYKAYTT